MKKMQIVAAILAAGLVPTGYAAQTGSNDKNNISSGCTEILTKGKFFLGSDSDVLPMSLKYTAISKGEFEKTGDFKKRQEKQRDEHYAKSEQAASTLGISGVVKFRHDYETYDIKYNPDKELLQIKNPPNPSFGSHTGKDVPAHLLHGFDIEETKGSPEFGPYGVKKTTRHNYGFFYRTSLKNPFFHGMGKGLSIKATPEKAKALSNMLSDDKKEVLKSGISLAVAGRIVAPYRLDFYSSSDNLSALSTESEISNEVVIDLTCAALIDRKTNQILLELR